MIERTVTLVMTLQLKDTDETVATESEIREAVELTWFGDQDLDVETEAEKADGYSGEVWTVANVEVTNVE